MSTITTISESVGANRIVPTVAIPYPVGNPGLEADKEVDLRRALVYKAVEALKTDVKGVTIFK